MENSSHKKTLFQKLAEWAKPVDLTVGKPWRVIIKYSVPIMLSYFLQQIYVLTDAIICGQVLSAEQVAGVNDTFPLTFIFLQFAFGCTAGFSVITARKVGTNDISGVRKSFMTQVYLSVLISAVLTLASTLLLTPMLRLINVTSENPEVYNAAYEYCFIIFIGIIAQMGYNFICGILRAYGDSVTPLVFLVISTLLNVGLDILFLVPLGMGPIGAAIATVLAQLISVAACCVYMFARYKELRPARDDCAFRLHDILEHLKQGLPLGFQFSILAFGIIVMQGAVVSFDIMKSGIMVAGTPAQNGFGAASKLLNFLMSLFQGLSSAILGYNAQNYGKGEYERIRKGTAQTLVIMLVIAAFCMASGMLLTIGGAYQYIFLSADKISPSSVMYGNAYLFTTLIPFSVLGYLHVMRSADQGIGKVGYVLGAGIAELAARVLICAFLPAAINGAAIDSTASLAAYVAVCMGDPGAWLAACVVLTVPAVKYIFKKFAPGCKNPY